MKNMQRTFGFLIVSLGLMLAAGCVVDQNGRVMFNPNAHVVVNQGPAESYQVQRIRQKAEQGDAIAQFTLGSCYANGRGIGRNDVEAVKWYHLSALQGYAPAQNRLGVCYLIGHGVARNYAAAVVWYRKAAQQGNASAQYNLGNCYYSGRGVALDYTEAVKWYRLSAEQGYIAAQNKLRFCESNGLGAGGVPGTAGGSGPTVQPPQSPNPTTTGTSDAAAEDPLSVDQIKMLNSAGDKPDELIGQIKSTNSKFTAQDITAAQQANPPLDPTVIECMKDNLK